MSDQAPAAEVPTAAVRRREPHRIVFDLLLIAFLATIVVNSLDLRPDSRLVPLIVGVPSVVAMMVRTVLDLRGTAGGRNTASAAASLTGLTMAMKSTAAAEAETVAGHQERRRQLVFAVWSIAVVIVPVLATSYLDPILGLRTYFLPSMVAGLLFIVRWVGMSWLKTVAITAGIGAFLYLMLGVFLSVRL